MSLIPVDYETIVLDDADVKALSASKYSPAAGDYAGRTAAEVWVQVQDGAVLWTLHGSDPSVADDLGMKANAGTTIVLSGFPAISRFKAVRTDASAVKLKVTYFFSARPEDPVVPQRLW